jgi:hypothetical protein
MAAFHPRRQKRVEAGLLAIGLRSPEFTAADLPAELTEGSTHAAGAATGALVATGLLEVTARIKSPDPRAKGRKLDVLRLASPSTARTWLRENGFPLPSDPPTRPVQQELALA